MRSDLKGYTEEKGIFGTGSHEGGAYDLAGIVRAAINLDLLLQKQKAYFNYEGELENRGSPMPFSPNWMTLEDLQIREEDLVRKKASVKLFCAPGLAKYGTSEGEGFENYTVISNAVVDCLVSPSFNAAGVEGGGGGGSRNQSPAAGVLIKRSTPRT